MTWGGVSSSPLGEGEVGKLSRCRLFGCRVLFRFGLASVFSPMTSCTGRKDSAPSYGCKQLPGEHRARTRGHSRVPSSPPPCAAPAAKGLSQRQMSGSSGVASFHTGHLPADVPAGTPWRPLPRASVLPLWGSAEARSWHVCERSSRLPSSCTVASLLPRNRLPTESRGP